MTVKGIIFITFAIIGAALNYTARPLSKKSGISELKIKVISLAVVLISVVLLFVFGK